MPYARIIRSLDELAATLTPEDDGPALLVAPDGRRYVVMTAAEFRRLKVSAGEPIPDEARERRPVVVVNRCDDPLGYDTSDFLAYASQVADDALSGRNQDAIRKEIEAVERRLGLDSKERMPSAEDGETD